MTEKIAKNAYCCVLHSYITKRKYNVSKSINCRIWKSLIGKCYAVNHEQFSRDAAQQEGVQRYGIPVKKRLPGYTKRGRLQNWTP